LAITTIFTLSLHDALPIYTDHNYKKDDVETAQLPSSVVVAEAVQGTVNPKGEGIAAYTIHTNGQVEFTFLEAVESVGAVDEQIEDRKSTRLNSSHVSISYA